MKRWLSIIGVSVVSAVVIMTIMFFRGISSYHSGNCRPFDVVNIRIGNNEFAVPPALKPEIGGYDRDLVMSQNGNVPRVEGRLRFCPRPPTTRIDVSKLRVEYPVLKSRKPSYLNILNLAFYDRKSIYRNKYPRQKIKPARDCKKSSPKIISSVLVDSCRMIFIYYHGLDIALFTDHAGINSYSDEDHVKAIHSFLDKMQTGAI